MSVFKREEAQGLRRKSAKETEKGQPERYMENHVNAFSSKLMKKDFKDVDNEGLFK